MASVLTHVNQVKTPGRFFSGKHEISSVYVVLCVHLCMCKYTVNESTLTLSSLGTGRKSSTPTHQPITTLSSSITEMPTWSSLKTVGGTSVNPWTAIFEGLMKNDVCLSWAGDLHMAGTSTRENGLKETVTLKWCTPRSNNIGGLMLAWILGGGKDTKKWDQRN